MKNFSARTGVDFFFEFCMMSFIIREMRVRNVVTLFGSASWGGKGRWVDNWSGKVRGGEVSQFRESEFARHIPWLPETGRKPPKNINNSTLLFPLFLRYIVGRASGKYHGAHKKMGIKLTCRKVHRLHLKFCRKKKRRRGKCSGGWRETRGWGGFLDVRKVS